MRTQRSKNGDTSVSALFSTEDLLLAMARPNDVLSAFDRERLERQSVSKSPPSSGVADELPLCELEDQDRFAQLLQKYWETSTPDSSSLPATDTTIDGNEASPGCFCEETL